MMDSRKCWQLAAFILAFGQLGLVLSTCGEEFQFSPDKLNYTISSPGYPDTGYPADTDCVWTFISFDYHSVHISVIDANFKGVASTACAASDKLEFKTSPANTALGVICNRTPTLQAVDKTKFVVRFRSTNPSNAENFTAGFSVLLIAKPFYELQCKPDGFNVQLQVSKLDHPSRYPYENYHLLEAGCTGTANSSFFTMESSYESCGTSFTNGEFSNMLLMDAKPITGALERPTKQLPILCKNNNLGEETVVSNSYEVLYGGRRTLPATRHAVGTDKLRVPKRAVGKIDINTNMTRLVGEFKFNISINVFDNNEFHVDGQADAWGQSNLYFEVSAPDLPTYLVLAARSCWISTSSDPQGSNQYTFMREGCPDTEDPIERYESTHNTDRFSLASIQLTGGTSQYHVHCNVVVCPANDTVLCEKSCIEPPPTTPPTTPTTPIASTVTEATYTYHTSEATYTYPTSEATTPITSGNGKIVGVVKDALRGNHLSSVHVTAEKNSSIISDATTSATGGYAITVGAGSGYRVTFTATGYHTTSIDNVAVTANEDLVQETLLYIDETITGQGTVSGKISNAITGLPEPQVTISFRVGINAYDGSVVYSVTTSSDGRWSTSLDTGHYTAELTKSGFHVNHVTITSLGGQIMAEQNGVISPVLITGETRVVLTWGQVPSDLDSHMTGPDGNGGRFHVFFGSKGSSNSAPFTNLDVDDTSSYGPETVTVDVQHNGVYRYSVHDYTNRGTGSSSALANSAAKVQVIRGDQVKDYYVPNSPGTLWTVFQIDGPHLTQINTMSYASAP